SRSFDSSRNRGSFDTSRRNELNRDFGARSNGYDRYNNRQRNFGGARASGARSRGARRRR
ncbi:MAG: hypothetical protein ACR2Q3_06950, partial [Woeseiaceae bacterium]